MKLAILAVLLLLNLPAHAETTFPLWISVTQEYNYPGTDLYSAVGITEQAIGEDSVNFIITASDGAQLKLPKAFTKTISAEDAAKGLMAEKNQLQNDYNKLSQENDKLTEAAEKKSKK